MKKIGIITFHYAINYGAVLQCFALREAVNSLEGCEADILCYCPSNVDRNIPAHVPSNLYEQKVKVFDEFLKNYLGITTKDTVHAANLPAKAYYITGSDQVWNTCINFVTSEYFLSFAPEEAIKISYSASLGSDIDKLRMQTSLFEKYISDFDFISVRENTHIDFIQQYTDKKVVSVLDPTLLHAKEKYLPMLSKAVPQSKFIFVFHFNEGNEVFLMEFANFLSIKYQMEIISFEEPLDFIYNDCTRSMAHLGPLDFLWYIKNAEFIITNSFHCTAFSIIFERPFYSFLYQNRGSRVRDLLTTLKLEDRIITKHKPLNQLNFDIDYKTVNKILEKEREASIGFLKNALGNKI